MAAFTNAHKLTSAKIARGRGRLVNSRSVFVAAVEDEERVGLSEEVLLVQLVATKLQHHRLLKEMETNGITDIRQPNGPQKTTRYVINGRLYVIKQDI